MISVVIIALSFAISLISDGIGAVVTTYIWQPKGPWELVFLCIACGAVLGFIVQHLFRRRDKVCTQWYEFSRDALLGIGAMTSFWGGSVFAWHSALASLLLALGFIFVTKACIVGPWQGWSACIGAKKILPLRS